MTSILPLAFAVMVGLQNVPPIEGSCGSGADSVDLQRVVFSSNTKITSGYGESFREVSIRGERLIITRMLGGEISSRVIDIGDIVGDGNPIDISLEFTVGDRLGIYWRETFQHQSYRQGLFFIDGDGVIYRCEGAAGIDYYD